MARFLGKLEAAGRYLNLGIQNQSANYWNQGPIKYRFLNLVSAGS